MADATDTPDELEALLEGTWSGRSRRFSARERRFEAGLTLVFLLAAGALLLSVPAGAAVSPWIVAVVLAYAAASLVMYPLGVGDLVPTQPFLIALFAMAPVSAVPLLVFCGLLLGRVWQVVAGDRHPERLVLAGGDAIHALGPAVVLLVFGVTDVRDAGWVLVAGAFAGQLLFDYLGATVREWVVHRVSPELQLPIMLQVAALDAALVPLGVLAVAALGTSPLAPLGLLPLVALLAYTARDRAERTTRLSSRLQALSHERARLREAVLRIGDALAVDLELDEVLALTTRTAVEALDAGGGAASVRPAIPGAVLAPVATAGDAVTCSAQLAQAQEEALATGGVIAHDEGCCHLLAAPLTADGIEATVAITRRSAFAPEEHQLFEHLCARASQAAGHIARHEALRRQALIDDLTGLVNHRGFQGLLADGVSAYEQQGTTVSLVLFDLDEFKQVNDTYGHQAGDQVLRAVARRLQGECRLTDEPARYGGEELAVVVRDTSGEQAAGLAERVRARIAAMELTAPDGSPLRVTISAGVATLGGPVSGATELIAAADRALYLAKANGRNRVEQHAEGLPVARVAERDPRAARPAITHDARTDLATTLARTLDARQPLAAGHSTTVADFAAVIAEGLGLDEERRRSIWLAGLVHDIGKVAVPDMILNKPARLNRLEYEHIKTHAEAGYDLLVDTVLREQATWVRHHHERIDGTGYPDQLAGSAIPLEARIIHVADAFEAMIADRPYRQGTSREEAAAELRRHSGTQFEPDCVEALLGALGLAAAPVAQAA